ncbi:YybS family protein [Anoxybacillus salavatliensis]|uniref:YybS family protein n=1 Tax=Anoxybacillus gonensis TaxID=198467 RepID=UPI0009465044|nr:YybS family protein [Anoxybacillus gonensis]
MKNARVLTEGAVQLAIFTVLLLLSLYMPVFGMVATFFLAIPFLLFTMRHTYKNGLFLLAASFIPSIWFGSLFSVPMTFMFASSGVAMGHVWRKHGGKYAVLLVGTLSFLVSMIIIYAGSVLFFDIHIGKQIEEIMQQSFQSAQNILEKIGQQANDQFEKTMKQTMDVVIDLLPTAFVFAAACFAWITQQAALPILKRLNMPIGNWQPFRELVLPKSLLWYYLATMLLLFFPIGHDSFLYIILINLFQILQLLMMIQGFSFIFYWTHHKHMGRKGAVAIVVLSLFFPFLLHLVRILGIIDLGFDLRKRLKD